MQRKTQAFHRMWNWWHIWTPACYVNSERPVARLYTQPLASPELSSWYVAVSAHDCHVIMMPRQTAGYTRRSDLHHRSANLTPTVGRMFNHATDNRTYAYVCRYFRNMCTCWRRRLLGELIALNDKPLRAIL